MSERLTDLPPGWDGGNARPVTEAAAATAEATIRRLEAAHGGLWQVVPRVAGGVQIERHEDGIDIEIDIDSDGSVECVFVSDPATRDEYEARGPGALDFLHRVLVQRACPVEPPGVLECRLDPDGYPADSVCMYLEHWPREWGWGRLAEYVETHWRPEFGEFRRENDTLLLDTGGMKGHRLVLACLKLNRSFWQECFVREEGTRYLFRMPEADPRSSGSDRTAA